MTRDEIAKVVKTSPLKPEEITIALLWTNFAGFVLPADAPALQREEMQKAFYAGFFECFSVHHDLAANLPDERTFAVLARLHKEASDFYEKLRKGST